MRIGRVEKMDFMDYNMWCSIIKYIADGIHERLYGIKVDSDTIEIVPTYPKHNAELVKPTIVVQNLYKKITDVGIGNVLGTTNDGERDYDVYGKEHSVMYQFIIKAGNNFDRSIITDALTSVLLYKPRQDNPTVGDIPLLRMSDESNVVIGNIRRFGDIDVQPLSVDEDEDYSVSVRATFNSIQSIIDADQDMVDLTKPISYRLKLNVNNKEGIICLSQ